MHLNFEESTGHSFSYSIIKMGIQAIKLKNTKKKKAQ